MDKVKLGIIGIGGMDATFFRKEVFRRMEAMVELATQKDVVLLHENERNIFGESAKHCLELMEAFGGEHFGVTFDFANFVQCGQDTLEAYEMLAPYIRYIHVKDALAENGKVVVSGTGDGKLAEIFHRLNARGYTGYLSLEPHLFNGEDSFVKSRDALEQLLRTNV